MIDGIPVQIKSTLDVGELVGGGFRLAGDTSDTRYGLIKTVQGDYLLARQDDLLEITEEQFVTASLQATVQVGYLEEVEPGQFRLTPEGEKRAQELIEEAKARQSGEESRS